MKKYGSFIELVRSFSEREGNAIQYLKEDGAVCCISYPELAKMILQRTEEKNTLGRGTDIIYASLDPDTITGIFASVIAGRCVLMASTMMPDKVLMEAQEGTVRLVCGGMEQGSEGELLFFTSGTTNRSKVVRLTSDALCCSAWNGQSMLECGPGDRILSLLPIEHVYGFVCGLLWGLAYGATVCLCPSDDSRLKMTGVFHPTILPAVPAVIDAMTEHDLLNPELRVVLVGAAPCSEETVGLLRERNIEVYVGYGLTETSSGIAITQGMEDFDAMHLCPDTDIRIEPDGEITVSTPCMMKGYLGQPETTEGYRLYTGDLGWLDDQGRLHLQGRKNDVLILSDGTMISCPEYEHDIAEMSGETDIALIDRGGKLVLVAGSGADTDCLRDAIEEYNKTMMISQQVYDIEVFGRPLPRTITGKLRRYELEMRYRQ